jgi:hypothetical protein
MSFPNPKTDPLNYLLQIAADLRVEKGQTASCEMLSALGALNAKMHQQASALEEIRSEYDKAMHYGHSCPVLLSQVILKATALT